MTIYHIVYKTKNLINNKIYIGVHEQHSFCAYYFDGYLGSGKTIRKAIKKYGRENFTREVLFAYGNAQEAYTKETEIVNADFIKLDTNYNIVIGGKGFTSESSKKVQKKRKERTDIPWHGDINYGEKQRNRMLKMYSSGIAPMSGERGKEHNKRNIENGLNRIKFLSIESLKNGTHSSQQEGFSEMASEAQKKSIINGTSVITREYKCPHCGEEFIGISLHNKHFNNCPSNPDYDIYCNTRAEFYLIEFPDLHKEIIHNMNNFCKDHNLWISAMSNVAAKKQKSHKGYICRKLTNSERQQFLDAQLLPGEMTV